MPASLNRKLNKQATNTEATFWISKILHLGVMFTEEAWANDALTEGFLDDIDENTLKSLQDRINVTRLIEKVREGDCESDEIRDAFLEIVYADKVYGFLCLANAPRVLQSGASKDISYGVTRQRWFYDEDLSGILKQADAWAKSLERVAA